MSSFKSANQLLREGKLDDAVAAYRQAIAVNPGFSHAHHNLGEALVKAGLVDEAVAAFRRAVELNPQAVWSLFKLGELLRGQERFEEAVGFLRRAVELKSDVAEFNLGLGAALVKLGSALEEAEACLRRAVELNPFLAEAFYFLGVAASGRGQWSEAVEFYGRGLEVNPNGVECGLGLAEALGKLGRWSEAVERYRQIELASGPSGEVCFGLGQALGQLGRWEEAVVEYRRAVALGFDGAEVRHHLGYALGQLGRWEEGVVEYRLVVEVNPRSLPVRHQFGYGLMQLGRWKEAEVELRKALQLDPAGGSAEIWQHLGDVLRGLGKIDEAEEVYRRALELNPNDFRSFDSLGDVFSQAESLGNSLNTNAQNGNKDEAYAHYLKAIALNPDYLATYHKAIAIAPQNYELYFKLGNALLKQNKLYGAIAFYKLAQILQPDDPKLSLQLEEAIKKSELQAETVSLISTDPDGDRQLKIPSPQLPIRRSYSYNSSPDDIYAQWLRENSPKPADFPRMAEIAKVLKYQPLISILMPVYNTDELFLREAILSVIDQVYPHWELCIADDASPKPHVKKVLEEYAAADSRIKLVFRRENGHISASSNSALELANGEFVALLDHDDVLTPDALYEAVLLLNNHPEADMIYSDEDKLNQQGERTQAYFKPDWSPESFLAQMYTCHLGVYRRSIIDEIGGFRKEYAGCQDYDLVLRFTEKTDKIFHIPKILYHWRIHAVSAASGTEAKPYVYELIQKLLLETINRRGEKGRIVQVSNYPGNYTIRYEIKEYKLVSIIIPTRNLGSVLNTCLKSIFEKSTYPNYEVVVIDNGSDEPETLSVFEFWKQQEPERFKCYKLDIPFNYSRINNYAVTKASGDYLLLLNNDTEVISPDWIEGMVEQAQREKIGAVGGLLLYPDGLIQHAGVVLGIGDVAGHSHHGFLPTHPGYFGRIMNVNNYSAVTGACLMCRREVFEEMGGLDEELAVAYNDVDLCLKMLKNGYRNVYLPHVVLHHHESKSRGYENTPEKQRRSRREGRIMHLRWGEWIENDPCYNPNLTREKRDYGLRIQNNALVEVLSVAKEQSELLFGCSIDSPVSGKRFHDNFVTIKGWVLGKYSKAVTVRGVFDGEVLQESPINVYRADVAKAYPLAKNEYGGFSIGVEVTRMYPKGELQLEAVMEDGSSVPIGVLELEIQLMT